MKQETLNAFANVANEFMEPDPKRPDEWVCRLCGGETVENGPVIHTPECPLTVLLEALEEAQ